MIVVKETQMIDILKDIMSKRFNIVDKKSIKYTKLVSLGQNDPLIKFIFSIHKIESIMSGSFELILDKDYKLVSLKCIELKIEENDTVSLLTEPVDIIPGADKYETLKTFISNNSYLIHKSLTECSEKKENFFHPHKIQMPDGKSIEIIPMTIDQASDEYKKMMEKQMINESRRLKIQASKNIVSAVMLVIITFLGIIRFLYPEISNVIYNELVLIILMYLVINIRG